MKNSEPKPMGKLFYSGLILIPIMISLLVFTSLNRNNNSFFEDGVGGFFVNYIISLGYLLFILFTNESFFKFKKIDKRLLIVSLIHFSISCFTLNNSIVLFAQFPIWVKVYLVISYSAFLGLSFIDRIPKILRYIVFFFLGSGLIITSYFAIYLAPIYHISLIGLLFFGLSIHILIPLFMSIAILVIYYKIKKSKIEKAIFSLGIIIPLIITSLFLYKWNHLQEVIHQSNSSIITRPNNDLPEWVLLCQDMPADDFSNKIIKGHLVFDTFRNMWGGLGNTRFNEVKRHDPLMNIGMAFMNDLNLDVDTRVKILKSQFNARHLTQRKLWSEHNLGCIEVLNNTQVFPEYRIAYTEKIISIKNFSQWEGNQQEASFTFYLPEGSVATSLSLWIDGKEEKSHLTTKSKADSAYVSIVGVERRDPALLHWQEGNTLTVTVFPCTPKENRKFKIGITSPLKFQNSQLLLENIYFDGPVSKDIIETSRISFESEATPKNLHLPKNYKKQSGGDYIYSGKFNPYWELSLEAPQISNNGFSFNGHSYHLEELNKKTKDLNPEKIYLDLNKSWTYSEFLKVLNILENKSIYVFHDKLILLNEENKQEIFSFMSKKNFSLFPFNQIKDWNNSLVISKSTELSPNLSDLEDSKFANKLSEKISSTDETINFFQIGTLSSPYIKTLKEFQILNFNQGNISDLEQLIKTSSFYKFHLDSSKINLHNAGISIIKDTLNTPTEAPDHLMRLFSYNSLMKRYGRTYFKGQKEVENQLIDIANEAFIVSPISSLIVLETQKDYDRFDIPENENSLKNASVKSSGAVPEPEEWALIILFIGIIGFLFLNKKKSFI